MAVYTEPSEVEAIRDATQQMVQGQKDTFIKIVAVVGVVTMVLFLRKK